MNLKKLKSTSFDEVRKFLVDYVKSKPEYDSKWKDFFESGAGTNLIDIASAVTAFLGFNSFMARKDSLLDYSALPSTVMTIASTLGYNYNRKSAPRLKLKITSAKNIFWKREIPIGTVKGRNIVLAENTMIKIGTHIYDVIVGDWHRKSSTILESKDFYSFSIDGNIDNRFYNLYINDEEIITERDQEKLDSNSVLIRSHKDGIFLIFGNGIQGLKPKVSSAIDFDYIIPSDKFLNLNLKSEEIKLNLEGILEESKVIDQGSNPDSMEKLVAVAPGYHSTQRMLISIDDCEYIGMSYEGIISCKARPKSEKCCAVDVFYLRQDELRFTPTQLEEFNRYLENHALLGTSFFIYPPSPIDVECKLKIVLPDPSLKNEVESLITSHIKSQSMKLGVNFSLASTAGLDLPSGVKVYVDYPIQDKIAKEYQYFRIKNIYFEYIDKGHQVELSSGIDRNRGYTEYEYEFDK